LFLKEPEKLTFILSFQEKVRTASSKLERKKENINWQLSNGLMFFFSCFSIEQNFLVFIYQFLMKVKRNYRQ